MYYYFIQSIGSGLSWLSFWALALPVSVVMSAAARKESWKYNFTRRKTQKVCKMWRWLSCRLAWWHSIHYLNLYMHGLNNNYGSLHVSAVNVINNTWQLVQDWLFRSKNTEGDTNEPQHHHWWIFEVLFIFSLGGVNTLHWTFNLTPVMEI